VHVSNDVEDVSHHLSLSPSVREVLGFVASQDGLGSLHGIHGVVGHTHWV